MKIFNVVWKALSGCVGLFIFPALALAVVANPSQLVTQSNRSSALFVSSGTAQEEMVSQLMVKPRYQVGDKLHKALRAHDASALAKISHVSMSVVREMSGSAHVIRLNQPVTLSQARIIAARLMGDNSVELAEPDRRKRPALTPTDPLYSSDQWNLFVPSSQNLGSANLPNAWNNTTGNNSVTVAVIDTGYRPHQDLGFTYNGSNSTSPVVLSSGYTFINDIPTANNGVGREPDALDPGDWVNSADITSGHLAGCTRSDIGPSSWHGTHVSGIIAAQMSNGIGIAGIAPNIQILPVRVLGKCGGYDSDIIDGMNWAAGIHVPNVPDNNHPAKVLNMSLGGSGGTACPSSYQTAVNNILGRGTVIVVAAGNDGTSTLSTPANCTGVIAVTANSIDGDNAYYATIGTGTTISAPGGDCGGMSYPNNCTTANSVGVYSLLNSGTTNPVASPGGDIYVAYSGTSMATPHVSAVAALMFSLNPSLTPALITSYLQSSARPFPSNTICTTSGSGQCGAGLLDAYQALNLVQPSSAIPPPVVTLISIPSTVTTGTVVTLSGSAVAGTGRSIASYAWTQVSGPATVTIINANTANASFTAPTTTGTYSFMLTVTDNAGQISTETTPSITVSATPSVANPVVSCIPSSGTVGTLVALPSCTVTPGSGRNIASYAWTQVSGPTTVSITNPGSNTNASFTPTRVGTYTFMLTAIDSSGQSGSASVLILINPSTPVVTLGSIPTSVTTGTTVTLSGSAVAVTGLNIASYAWTQLSGPTVTISNPSSNTNASFTPSTVGSYSFLLTATDSSGQTGTATTPTINVSAPSSIAPISGGKGGGSMDFENLFLLMLIAVCLRLRRRYVKPQF